MSLDDHDDELVSSMDYWFHDSFVTENNIGFPVAAASKKKFELHDEPIADIFSTEVSEHATISKNLTSELHSEIASLSSLLHTRSSSSISSFERRGAAIRRVFAAVRRQRTAQSAALVAASDESSALLDAKQSAKSSNPSAKIGFRLAIRMLLALIKNAAKADDHSILDEILEEASILVSELPVLSLCSSEFDSSVFLSSGDINEALKPAIQYMHQILTYDWSTDRHRAWALQILLAMSLARGSLVDTLALVQKLCASTLQLDVGTLLQTLQTLPVYDRNAPHHSTAHPHPLTLCPLNGPLSSKSGWNCDGRVGDTHACARDNVVRGRPRYRCSECDFDLCDLCYQATRKSMDVAPAPSYPEFPYSVQQCVEVFATQSSDLIEAPVAALFILAHLERLASPFAPLADALTSQKSDDAPKLSHPLSLEVSAKTFEQLHDLLAALVDAPSRIQSRGILAVLKILFSHIQVASDANARFDFGKTDSLLTLLLRLTDAAWTTSNSDLDIVMKVNICAARIITAGFRYFYPTASQQLQFLLVLFRSERPLLPHELQILRSVKSTFTRFGGSIVDELQMGPVMNECHPSIAALIELGLNQSLSLLAGKESNSSDFGPVDLLKSFQLHLMARLHSALLPTPGDSVPDNVRWTLLSLLCSYARAIVGTARQLIDACHQHINVLQETKLSDLELIVEHVLGTSIVVQLLRPLVSSITALRYSPSPPPSTVTVVTTVATEAGEYGVLQPEAQSDSMMIALQCVPALQSVISDLDRFLASVYDKLLRSNLLKVPRKVNRTPTAVAASEIPFNRAGFPMRLGVTNVYYCSRRLGTSAIPRSDGQCGPNNGPQCDDCKAGVDSYSAPLNRAGVKMSPGTAPQLYCGRTIGVSALNGAKLVCGPLDGPQCDDCRAGPVVQPEIESDSASTFPSFVQSREIAIDCAFQSASGLASKQTRLGIYGATDLEIEFKSTCSLRSGMSLQILKAGRGNSKTPLTPKFGGAALSEPIGPADSSISRWPIALVKISKVPAGGLYLDFIVGPAEDRLNAPFGYHLIIRYTTRTPLAAWAIDLLHSLHWCVATECSALLACGSNASADSKLNPQSKHPYQLERVRQHILSASTFSGGLPFLFGESDAKTPSIVDSLRRRFRSTSGCGHLASILLQPPCTGVLQELFASPTSASSPLIGPTSPLLKPVNKLLSPSTTVSSQDSFLQSMCDGTDTESEGLRCFELLRNSCWPPLASLRMIPGSIAPLVLSTVRHAFTALLRHTNATAALLAWFHTTSSSAPSEMTLDDSDEADVDAPPEYLTQMLRTAARLADEIISCKARGDDCVQWHNAFMERYRLLTQTVLPPAGLRASDLISRGVVLGTTTSSALGRSDIPSLPTTGMSGHSMLQLVRTNTGSTRLQPVEELESDSDGEDGMPPVMSGLQLARTNSRYSKATQITSLLRSTQVALQPSGDTPISPHAPGGGSQTLKRIRSLIDARAAATVAIQNVAPHPSDNPVALHIKAVVEFLQASGAESTPDMLNPLVDSMAQQQARCVARMLAVHFIADGIDALSTRQMSARSLSSTEAMTKPCVYAPSNVLSGYWLHQFSSALRQPSDKSTTENKLHILAQTESVGPRMRAQLNRRYLALSSKLMSQCIVENDAAGALQVLNSIALPYTGVPDLIALNEANLIDQLSPLLTFTGSNSNLHNFWSSRAADEDVTADSSSSIPPPLALAPSLSAVNSPLASKEAWIASARCRALPWALRYSAWSVFRLIAYVTAQSASVRAPATHPLLQSVMNVMRHHIEMSLSLRQATLTDTKPALQPEAVQWTCGQCEFVNEPVGVSQSSIPESVSRLLLAASAQTCQLCQAARPTVVVQKPVLVQYWSCSTCAFVNQNSNTACEVCDASRSAAKALDTDSDDDEDLHGKSAMAALSGNVGKTFVYVSDFDENGIMFHLGCDEGASSWKNPAERNLVSCMSSTIQSDSLAVTAICGREAVRCVTESSPDQWMQVKFERHAVRPTAYSLRHYISWPNECLRNWRLEGSLDGTKWTMIKEHTEDPGLNGKGSTFTWQLPSTEQFYTHFRIFMFGPNNNGGNYLACSGMELYGQLVPSAFIDDQGCLLSSVLPQVARRPKLVEQRVTSESHVEPDMFVALPEQASKFLLEPSDHPVHATYISKNESWGTVRMSRLLSSGRVRVDVLLENEPASNGNSWRMIFGCVPASFNSTWIGSGGGWGWIAGSGSKNHLNSTAVSYGSPYKAGDTLGILLDFDAATIEFFLNGQSQGIAFDSLKPDVYVAASLTGTSTKLTILPAESPQSFEVPSDAEDADDVDIFDPVKWQQRAQSLGDSHSDWFRFQRLRMQELSTGHMTRRQLNTRKQLPSTAEIDSYLNQFLWVLLRTCRNEAVRERLHRPIWLRIILQLALSSNQNTSKHSQLLALRILRYLLPALSPTDPVLLESVGYSVGDVADEAVLDHVLKLIGQTVLNESAASITSELTALLRVVLGSRLWNESLNRRLLVKLSGITSLQSVSDSKLPENVPFDVRNDLTPEQVSAFESVVASLEVLGANDDSIREGARVKFANSSSLSESTHGVVTRITLIDSSTTVLVQPDSIVDDNGDVTVPPVVTITNMSLVTSLPAVALSLQHLTNPLELVQLLGRFLSADSHANVSSGYQLVLAQLRRRVLKVVTALLHSAEFARHWIFSGFAPLLSSMACTPLSGNQVDTGHDTDSAKLRAVLAFDDVRPAPLKCEVLESRQAALLDRLVDADVVRQSVALVAGNVQRPTFVFIDELKRTTATGNSDVSDKICLEDGDILKGRRQARVFKVRVWTSKSDSTVCSVQFVYEHSQSGNVDYFDGAMHGKVPTDIGRPTHCLNLSADECITALSLFWDQSRTPATLAALRIKTNAGQQLTAGSAPETMDLTPKSKTSSWQVVVVPNQHAVKGFFSFVDGDGELRSVGALTHSFKQFNLDSSTSTTNNMLTFVHSTDFDENGLMYWFGTKGKTVVWQNPHTLGDVTVTCSNIKQDSSPVSAAVGREVVRCVTESLANMWFAFRLNKGAIRPSAYTLRHYKSWDVEALRNWQLEVSSDGGATWTVLMSHKDDKHLNGRGASHTWALQSNTFYSMFRVFQTGKNSNGNDYLALSGFELYGDYMEGTPEEISKLNSVGFVSQSLGSSVNSVSRSAPFPDAAWLCGSACNYFADLPLLGVPDTAANEVARHETRFPLIVQSNSGGASAGIYSGWTFHPNQDFAGELSRADVRGDALAEWACCFPQAQAFSTDGCLKPSVPSRQQWTRSDTTGNTSGVYVRNQTFGTSLISPANSGQTANSSNRVLMNLQLSLLWAERGEHSSTYSAQSVLRDDDSNYSSKGHHTTADLLFGRKGDPAGDSAGVLAGAYRDLLANPSDLSLKSAVTLNEASFNVASKVAPSSDQLLWLTSMIARGPPSHFTAPVERGLVFAIDHPSQIASAQKYNSYTAADFDALMASEKDADASDPIGFFDLSQSSRTPVPSSDGVRCALFRMSRFRPSRFLLVKLIQTKVDENVDINYLGFIQDRDELSDLEFSSEPVKLSRAASSASQTDSSHMLINMVSGQVSSTEYRIAPATSREVAVRQHPNNHIKMDDGAGLIVTLPAFDNSSAGWSITMQVGITALVPLFPVTLFSVQPIELPIDSQSLLSLTVVDEDNEVGPVFSLVAGNHDSEIVSKSVIEIDTDLDLCDGVARTFVITVSDNRISVYLSNEVILELELTSNSQMFQSAKNGFRAVVGARLQGTLSNVAYWAEPLSEVKSLGLDAVATEFQSRQKVDSRIQLLKFVGHGNHQVESHGAVPVSYMTMDQLKQILSASSGDVVSDSVQSSHSAALALLSNSSRARVRVLLKPLAASSTQTSSHRSVSRFTLIMDVLMTEFPHSSAESVCLFCPQANDVPSSSLCVSKSGRLELLGVRSDVKMQTHKWHRIAMIVDARGQSALVYLDGKLAMTVNSASAVRRQRIPLLSFEQLSLGSHFGLGGGQTEQSSELTVGLYVRAVQLSNVLKSEAEIVELFQLDNQTGQYLDFAESRPEAEKCRMLTALGWNLRWASLAMNACGNSLAASNRWLRQHQELLKLEDESIKVRALAQSLTGFGPSFSRCVKALSDCQQDVYRALEQLSCESNETSDTDQAADLEAPVSWSIPAVPVSNSTQSSSMHRMLRSTTDTLSDDSVQLERNATRPAMVSSFAAVRELTYLSEIRRALVAGESALCVLHARQSILLLFKLWTSDSCSAFPLDVLGGQKFFSDFVRLLDFDSHPTLAPETSWSVFHNALKILIFNELSLRQGSFDSNTPLTKALHKETLISLLYLSQDETRSLNVDTEHVALKHVSAELALFLLQTLCDVALESNQRWLLGQAVTNIMFAAMSADRVTINVRIALIRLMTRLIRADVTIEVRHLLPVKQSMNQLHSMTTSTPELTPLLLALIDLVIAADNSQTVKVAMNAYLKRFSDANEHRRLIEAQKAAEILEHAKAQEQARKDERYKRRELRKQAQTSEAVEPDLVPEVLRSFVPDSMSSSVLDQSGLLYWLGTVGGTEEWQNPALMRHSVDVQLSSVMADSKPAHFVVGRESVRCVTRNEPNQWLLLDLHGLLLRPSHYALRHYLSWDVEALRSWRFEASRDRVHWKLLRQHVDDTTLYTKGQTAVFALTGDPASSDASEAFSYFRVVMTGKNSNLHWYLACSGMELYGDLIAEPKSAADPNSDSSDDDESASNVAVDSGKLKAFVDTQLRTWNLLLPASGIGTSSSIVSSLDIDQCGLFYWLGADGHTSSWKNPADSSVAVSFSPSLQADSQPAASLTARTLCRMVTKAGSMIMLPSVTVTIPKPMVVTHYTLRHYSSWDTEALRSWCFEGSTDGQEWKVLHEVTDDTTLSLKGQCGTWTVPSSQSMLQTSQTSTQFDADALSKASFTQYRLKMISVNSNKNWYLALCGLELYGFVLHSEPSASVPLQSDNVMSRESTGSSTTSTVSISNESNLISERLGLPSDAPWFSAVSMLEKTIHALRPALSSVMTSTSSSVRVQIPLPSSFIAQVRKNVSMGFLCKILADGDFDRELSAAHALWTEIADEQLVRAVNIRCEKRGIAADSLLADTLSFTASELAHFDALAQHSERSIRLRLVVLQELNRIVVRTLPLIDLACAPGASTLCDAIREARSLIFWTTKRELWESVLEKTKSSASPATIQLQLDVFRANTLKEKRRTDYRGNRTLFGQAYQQLKNKDAAIYRLDKGKQVYKTLFVGQFADDYGGPYRASIVQMCAELQDMVLPLFIPVPNARARVGKNRECWVPRPTAVRPLDLSMLEFLGQLFGAAVRSRVFMDLNLPSIVWKQLVQQPVTEADVLGIDVLSFKIVDQLETMVAECDLLNDAEAAREMFESIDARYVAMGSDGHEVPLIPQGHSTPITLSNCRAFIKALRQFRLAEFRTQVEAIRRGLATVVPYPMLSLLTWDELQVQVCGRPKFDVDLLFSQTVYEDCSLNDLHIQLFWRVLRERFDDNERSKFLAFVWGQSRLPLHASDFERKFKIMRYVASESNPAKFLPISHTCFFSIELPKYSTLELMHSRLLLAITHCDTIDADGTSNGIANARLQMNVADDDDAGPSLFA